MALEDYVRSRDPDSLPQWYKDIQSGALKVSESWRQLGDYLPLNSALGRGSQAKGTLKIRSGKLGSLLFVANGLQPPRERASCVEILFSAAGSTRILDFFTRMAVDNINPSTRNVSSSNPSELAYHVQTSNSSCA